MSDQIPLNFEHRPSLSGQDFLVAACNADAVSWLDKWPEWSGQGLVIYGEKSCGKTHLANVFMAKSKALLVSQKMLIETAAHDLVEQGEAFVLEAADQLETEEPLFHFYNAIREAGKTILITALSAPVRWSITLPDLRSRLNALPAVEIGVPDDYLREAVLFKLFSDRQLAVDRSIVLYLLARIERSFEAAQDVVTKIDAESLASKRNITIPLVRTVLEDN
ncbi:MAG: DnaA/Hda family protein [Alphaproteobacteria bacterium]|nr:DnaA/Hda family protein [Rhodospirillales bacterium]MCW9046290.1 DnaA/Hda family protein [Alphaproteobacteria bacterium]